MSVSGVGSNQLDALARAENTTQVRQGENVFTALQREGFVFPEPNKYSDAQATRVTQLMTDLNPTLKNNPDMVYPGQELVLPTQAAFEAALNGTQVQAPSSQSKEQVDVFVASPNTVDTTGEGKKNNTDPLAPPQNTTTERKPRLDYSLHGQEDRGGISYEKGFIRNIGTR